MLKKLYGKLESSINALDSWMKERKNLAGLLVGIAVAFHNDSPSLKAFLSHPQVRSTIDNAHCQIPSLGHESSLALCLILQPILFLQKPTGATLLGFWTISNHPRTYLLHSGQKVIVASLSMWSPTDVFIIKHFVHMRGPSPGISTPQIQHFLSITVYLQYWYTVQARLPRSELIISKLISSSE